MTVFNGYLLMMKKKAGYIVLYMGIFVFLALLLLADNRGGGEKGFSAASLNIILVDQDQSSLSGMVADYLKKHHTVAAAAYDRKKLYESLYYRQCDLVVRIPEGMEADAGKVIEVTQSPGSYSGIFVGQQIGQMVSGARDYQRAGYTAEEACRRAASAPEAQVTVLGAAQKADRYVAFFRYVPYLMLGGLGAGVAQILCCFRRREVNARMMASSVSLVHQNVQAVASVLLLGFLLLAVVVALAAAVYGGGILQDPLLPYCLINLFFSMLLALSLAFLVGMAVRKESAINMCFTTLSLSFSFLGGCFVALEFFSPGMLTLARFIPVYWYEVVNDLLMQKSSLSEKLIVQIWQAYGVQFLFAAAFFSAGLVIARYRQQPRS